VGRDQEPETDARSVVQRLLVAATGVLLTVELLVLVALLKIVMDFYIG
jgi:hypothetical protein